MLHGHRVPGSPSTSLRPICIGLLGIWLGCNPIAGIREGKPYPDACKTVADCEARDVGCRVTSCESERCVYVDAPEGTPLPLERQTVGDCVELQCDGAGKSRIVAVAADIPEDHEGCTFDECVGTQPRNSALSSTNCYSGPPGTAGIGNCRGGIQACENGKPVGPCMNERIPQAETCLTIFDDDCDGSVNEEGDGCICVPGTVGACYPGNQESLGYGKCSSGTQFCNMLGTAYDECSGFVQPAPEICDASGEDEDCDGRVNEEGVNCVCGDGFVSNGEVCDDSNLVNGDGCTSLCELPSCGDNIITNGEECDDGNPDDSDACTTQCNNAVCGDGFIEFGVEECDDGNLVTTDSCTAECKIAICGDSIIHALVEECDDGAETDHCGLDCKVRPPRSCADVKAKDPEAQDGDYTLYLGHDPAKPWVAYCNAMNSAPAEYLSLVITGQGKNYAQRTAGGAQPGTNVVTTYTKIRLNPITLQVTRGDLTFATSVGSVQSGPMMDTTTPYGLAWDCISSGSKAGVANLDLTGTPFVLPMGSRFQQAISGGLSPTATDAWCTNGAGSAGTVMVSPDLKIANLTGGGFCGGTSPKSLGATQCDDKLILTYAP